MFNAFSKDNVKKTRSSEVVKTFKNETVSIVYFSNTKEGYCALCQISEVQTVVNKTSEQRGERKGEINWYERDTGEGREREFNKHPSRG